MTSENIDRVRATGSKDSSETEPLSNEEALVVHEDVFKSGIPVGVDETPERYRQRVNDLWEVRKTELAGKLSQHERQSESDEITESVAKWLGHPLTEEYARRYAGGESLDDILQGQDNVEDKSRAIIILAEHQVPRGELRREKNAQPETTSIEDSELEGLENKAYARAKEYIEVLKKRSDNPEIYDNYLQRWQDPAHATEMERFLLNAKYKELRTAEYQEDIGYDSTFEFACSDDSLPHKKQNGWIYRGILSSADSRTETRGSLNVEITKECINELDQLILDGVVTANYKFGEPNTPAASHERHDAITLYFLEEPSDEALQALSQIASKHYRGGSLLGKEVSPGFCMSEVGSVSDEQARILLDELELQAPEIVTGVRSFLTVASQGSAEGRVAMSEAQYYAVKETLALHNIDMSLDDEGKFTLAPVEEST